MAGKRRKRSKPYYGKKGGSAVYKNEVKFDIFSTLKSLKDYYEGKSEDSVAGDNSKN